MSDQFVELLFDDRAVARYLSGWERQIPFIKQRTMKFLADDAREEVIRELPSKFIVRRKWIQKGIRTKAGTKANPDAIVGSRDEFMRLQQEGGIKPKHSGPGIRGKQIPVPLKVRKNERVVVSKAKRPYNLARAKKLIRGNKPFVQKSKKGVEGIWVRSSKRYRLPMLLLYHIRRDPVRVKKRDFLLGPVTRTVKQRAQVNFEKAVKFALATAR